MFLWTDWILIIIILISTLLSLRHGFFRELLSFLALLLAFYVALTHNEIISIQFNKIFGGNFLTPGYAMAGSFFIIMWVATKIIQKVKKRFKKYNIGIVDRFLGTIFGFARGVIVASLILAFSLFSIFTKTDEWKTTAITNQLQPFSNYFIVNVIPEKVLSFVSEQLKDVDDAYKFQKAKNIINNSFGADFKVNKQILEAGERAEKKAAADKVHKENSEEGDSTENKEPTERIFQKPAIQPEFKMPPKEKSDREVLLEKQHPKTTTTTDTHH